jgi:hypothetical protein
MKLRTISPPRPQADATPMSWHFWLSIRSKQVPLATAGELDLFTRWETEHLVPCPPELRDEGGANEPRTVSDEYSHVVCLGADAGGRRS